MLTADSRSHEAHPKPGTHIGLLYEDPDEYLTTLTSFFEEGLRQGEQCVHVTDDLAAEQVVASLIANGVDTERELERGALRFVSKSEYRRSEDVDPQVMAAVVRDLIDKAVGSGFRGLRLSVDMTWTMGPSIDRLRVARWESLWNEFFTNEPMVAICAYNRRRLSAELAHTALLTHPCVVAGREFSPNLVYQPPAIFLNGKGRQPEWIVEQMQQLNATLASRARQQRVVAELGQRALAEHDLQNLLEFTTAVVPETLGVELCEVQELVPEDRTALLRAGTGWAQGLVGTATTSATADSQVGYVLQSQAPVIVENLQTETRFSPHELLKNHRVISGISCVISGTDGNPLGVLGAHTVQERRFTEDDVHFLQAVANILASTTERSSIEKALREADRRKDEFLATLAHELRNPLAPISNAIELMGMVRNDAGRVNELRVVMDHQVRQMVRLIDDLMDVSRISRGKLELRKERVALKAVVDPALEACRWLIDDVGQQLIVEHADESLVLEADAARLTQALVNLLNNASKYSPPSGRIWLTTGREADSAWLRVRDNGIGIPAEKLTDIFDMFSQIEPHLDGNGGGLGIGLALVRQLVEMHGGSIEARSDGLGRGSEFIIRIPLLVEDGVDEAGPVPEEGQVEDISYRILVAEDAKVVADIFAMVLTELGHEVRVVEDAPAALRKVHVWKPDIIFSDVSMPGMSGYELAKRLREQPELRDIVLVAVTGYSQPEDRELALKAGFDHHLVKPAEVADLQALFASIKSRGSTSV